MDMEKVINVLSKHKKHTFGDKEEKVTVEEIIVMLKTQTQTIEQFEREREQQMWNMPPMGGFHDD